MSLTAFIKGKVERFTELLQGTSKTLHTINFARLLKNFARKLKTLHDSEIGKKGRRSKTLHVLNFARNLKTMHDFLREEQSF